MVPPKKQDDADDVLDFINSLPDSKPGTPQPQEGKAENKEELLDFLDELANKSTKSEKKEPSKGKFEPKNKKKSKDESKESTPQVEKQEAQPQNANEELEINPIESISSWWNKEGSNKVSSLWGSITSNAATLSETTFQIASNTSNQISQQRQKFLTENAGGIVDSEQILNISNKLNSILLNMSQQIKEGLLDDDDELLNILLIYDLYNLNYLDKLCYDKFHKVMSQVEGGIRTTVSNFHHKDDNGEVPSSNIDLNMFYGKSIDGEKLCFANLDLSIKDYLKILKLEEESKKIGDEPASEDHKLHEINKSNIFIAVQPICTKVNQEKEARESEPIFIETNDGNSFSFTLILKDVTNDITIVTKTQPFPIRWVKWLSGDKSDFKKIFGEEEKEEKEERKEENKEKEEKEEEEKEAGNDDLGIEPGEWVEEWIKDGLSLSFAVLAQEYVTRRMGV